MTRMVDPVEQAAEPTTHTRLGGPTPGAKKLAVLVLPESPFPPTCGNALRDVQQITLLRRLGYQVVLLCVRPRIGGSAAADKQAAAAQRVAIEFVSETVLDFRESRIAAALRKISYLRRTNASHPFSWWCTPYGLYLLLPERLIAIAPDVVVLRSLFLDLIPALCEQVGAKVIVDCHDADAHLAREMVRSVPWWRKLGPFANYRGVRTVCAKTLSLADEIWAVSVEDAARIRPYAGSTPVLVVPSGVDEAAVAPMADPAQDDACAMIANYAYGPNFNAVRWLVERVWPRVRRARPTAKLLLVGAGAEAGVRRLAATCDGIEVTGGLLDLSRIYAEAGVVLAPLREGGGTRLKIIEAWKHGKAVVTTSKGMEGIPAPPGTAAVADSPEAFADILAELLGNRGARKQLGETGRRFVTQELSFGLVARQLASVSLLSMWPHDRS